MRLQVENYWNNDGVPHHVAVSSRWAAVVSRGIMAAGCPVRWFCSIRQREDTTGSRALTSSRRARPPADLLDLCVWVLYPARRRVAPTARTHFSNCGTIYFGLILHAKSAVKVHQASARENQPHCIKSRILNPIKNVSCIHYIYQPL